MTNIDKTIYIRCITKNQGAIMKKPTPVTFSARLDERRKKRLIKIKKKWELEDMSDTLRKMIDFTYKLEIMGEKNA